MVSGLVSFEAIVEAVKDETGIENMRNYYERIKRLLFRAEKEIGYGGSVVLKKAVYIKNENGFDGSYIQFPVDFIEHEGLGNCNGRFAGCMYSFRPEGIRMTKSQDKVVLLYYAIFCDGQGNPVTTHNHFEAIVNFIVWKLYSSKFYLGLGNLNAKKDYQYEYERSLHASRGFDAMPTTEEWTEIGHLTYQDRRILIMYPTAGYDYCDDTVQAACLPIVETTFENIMKVYYWQETTTASTVETVQSDYNIDKPNYFADKFFDTLTSFQQGKVINYTNIGRICFAIQATSNLNWQIMDALNNDVTDLFNTFYDVETQTIFFVSIENYTYSSIYFKFKILENVTIPDVSNQGVYNNAYNEIYN